MPTIQEIKYHKSFKERYNFVFSFVKKNGRLPFRGECYFFQNTEKCDIGHWFSNQCYFKTHLDYAPKRFGTAEINAIDELLDYLKNLNNDRNEKVSEEVFFDEYHRLSMQKQQILGPREFVRQMGKEYEINQNTPSFRMQYKKYLIAMKTFFHENRATVLRYSSKHKYSIKKGIAGPKIVSYSNIPVTKNRYRLVTAPKSSYLLVQNFRYLNLISSNDVRKYVPCSETNYRYYEVGHHNLKNKAYVRVLSFFLEFAKTSPYIKKQYDRLFDSLIEEKKFSPLPKEILEAFRYYPSYLENLLPFKRSFASFLEVYNTCLSVLATCQDENISLLKEKIKYYLLSYQYDFCQTVLIQVRIASNLPKEVFPKIYLEKEDNLLLLTEIDATIIREFLKTLPENEFSKRALQYMDCILFPGQNAKFDRRYSKALEMRKENVD